MATKKPVEKDPELQIEEALTKSEMFIQKNGKLFITILVIAILVAGGIFGYKQLYSNPRIEDATNSMFEAQIQFERDSFAVALNGVAGVFDGFKAVAADFSGTPQGNLATHYAGICAMQLGDFAGATTYFKAYSPSKSAAGEIIDAQNVGLQGDCAIELGNVNEAISLYKQAIAASTSDATAPVYAQKAAIALFSEGKAAEAIEMIQSIKVNNPASLQARDADKYIAHFSQSL
ncbi:MAG: hypothetical protein R3Y61_08235 [Rikenellaceae bacterium]